MRPSARVDYITVAFFFGFGIGGLATPWNLIGLVAVVLGAAAYATHYLYKGG